MNQDAWVVIEHIQGQVADISYVMLAAARALVQGTGGQVVAVLLGHKAEGLAADLAADRVLYVDDPLLAEYTAAGYAAALVGPVEAQAPRAVLFGDTSIGADMAGGLSVRLGLPLVSYCRELRAAAGGLQFVSQICGGKVMAEGALPEPTALVTMIPGGYKSDYGHGTQPAEVVALPAPDLSDLRVTLKQYHEPDTSDVDISRESILVAVGRGIQRQDNLELAEELAELLGGVVCASRPIVDQGWLPTSRLVGKSGKRVKPTLYLALGISGAPEHVEAIPDSQMIIAVNTDPAAPIFDLAQYGAEIDMFDLLPVLTEKVREIKGG